MSIRSCICPANWSRSAGAAGLAAVILLSSTAVPATAQPDDEWLGPDKVLHFIASFMITSVSYSVAREYWDWEHEDARRLGLGLGLAAGIAKEAWDGLSGRGRPSGKDLLWDLAGVGAGAVLINQVRWSKDGGTYMSGVWNGQLRAPERARIGIRRAILEGAPTGVLNGIDSAPRPARLRLPPGLTGATSSVG